MFKFLRLIPTALITCLFYFAFSSAVFAAPIILTFLDDFKGDLGNWTVDSGDWSIVDESAQGSTTGKPNFLGKLSLNTGQDWDNYETEVTFNIVSGDEASIWFRDDNKGNSYELAVHTGISAGPPTFTLYKHGQTTTVLGSSKGFAINNNQNYFVRIISNKTDINVYIDDIGQVISTTDVGSPIISNGTIGLSYLTNDSGSASVLFPQVGVISMNQPTTKTPLIIIPGVGGSEFSANNDINWSDTDGHGGTFKHNYPKGEKVWVNEGQAALPGNDDYFDVLKMNSNGITPSADLSLSSTLYSSAYDKTLMFFINQGYTLNHDLFVFPYDWRKDLSSTGPLLDQKIESIKTQTGASKVDLVAHSMGGLVARNYISNSAQAAKVDKLITLGAPYLGSVESLKTLMYGDCLTPDKLKNLSLICIGLSSSEVKDVMQNMPGAYELAPTQQYYSLYNGSDAEHPLPFDDVRDVDNNKVTGPLNYQQTKTLMASQGYNTSLYSMAENFHNLDNQLSNTNGVDVTTIVGSGEPTIGQIVEKYKFNFAGIKIPETDLEMVNGDDTVPILSASLGQTDKVYYTKQHHGNLQNDEPSLLLALNVLDGSNVLSNNILTEPFPLKGKLLSVHSPVNIDVYDQNGKHTGFTDGENFEENIPGSDFETVGDAKFVFLPDDGQYKINFTATDNGSFDFKIRDYQNNTNDQTIVYSDIPLTTATKGTTTFNTINSNPPVLQIDENGDGANDLQVNPSQATPTPSSTPTPAPTCPKAALGDIDCDGSIGIFDYNTLVSNFNQIGTGVLGDIDNSGKVDIFDYNILVSNFGV